MDTPDSQQNFIHPWNELPHINNNIVSMLVDKINSKQFTPHTVFKILKMLGLYLNCKQLRTIQSECFKLHSDYNTWYLYEHVLCSRVTDRWNLTPKYGVEGYYYCSFEQARKVSEPPYE
jgi:hypothetical protein